jgi:putative peptidoglycan lipid II flippase
MVREMVYASFMGNGWVASAFFMAFQVPNLFRRLLGEGALTAAFIPIFKQKEVRDGHEEMWRSANAVISGLVIAAGVITLLAVAGISLALPLVSGETRLMLELLRFMFPYALLACLAAVLIGMANARGHFFVPALGAVILNVVMISSVLLLAPHMGSKPEEQIFGLAIGVVLAGIAQAFFQLPSLHREGFRYQWVSPWNDPTVREVVRKMLPGSIGVAAFQINVLLTQCFSFWFDAADGAAARHLWGVAGDLLASYPVGAGGGKEISGIPSGPGPGLEPSGTGQPACGGHCPGAGSSDRSADFRAREIRSRCDAACGSGAGLSGARPADVLDEQHLRASLLRAE